jgi:tetratricopeptide (TPR) repeat protein
MMLRRRGVAGGGGATTSHFGSASGSVGAACLALGVVLAAATRIQARPITVGAAALSLPTSAAELRDIRAIAEVEQAVKSFERREFDACLQQLGMAVKAHPELAPPGALFAKLAFVGDQPALARSALERAVTEDPEHPEVYVLFGNLALMESRLTDASVHFEKAKSLAKAERWTDGQRQRFGRLCHEGNAFVPESRGNWKAAQTALSAWLEQEPSNARARYRLGKVLFSLGEQNSAFQELKRAANDDATIEPAPITMGWLYTRDRNYGKAQEWMDYVVKIAPDALRVRTAVASWLLEQGRGHEAQTQVEAAAKLDAKSNEVKWLLGLAARAWKDFSRSEEIFQALALESPGDAWLRNQLALMLVEQADGAKKRKALELAELSVRQNPNAADALATLGTVYFRLNRLDDAEKVLRAVVASGKGNSDAAYMLARVQADQGHLENAPSLLRTALAAPGLFIFRKDAQEWLERVSSTPK